MKKLIIVFAIFLMLAGGTISLLKYLNIGPFEKTPEEIAADEAAVAAGDSEQAAKKSFFEAKLRYVEMDPIQVPVFRNDGVRSEEHTSELQSQSTISYAVFCLKKKRRQTQSHPGR